jgi:hypothetical protein
LVRLNGVAKHSLWAGNSNIQHHVFGEPSFIPKKLPQLVAVGTQFDSRLFPVFQPRVNRSFPEDADCKMSDSLRVDFRITHCRIGGSVALNDIRRYLSQKIIQRETLIPRFKFWQYPILTVLTQEVVTHGAQQIVLRLPRGLHDDFFVELHRFGISGAAQAINGSGNQMAPYKFFGPETHLANALRHRTSILDQPRSAIKKDILIFVLAFNVSLRFATNPSAEDVGSPYLSG